jgi:secondary thiamine-phosphate synthase enzyme
MKILNKEIEFKTKEIFEFIDITDEIEKFAKESGIKNGIINVFIMHTSAALIANENEPLLIEDFKKSLEKTASKNENYKHDNMEIRTVNVCKDECINGHSHCKAIYLLANVVLNLIEDKLQLGQWQRIMAVELDRPRQRKIQIQIIGE